MQYTNSQMTHLIDEHIHSERDRALLKRRLIDGVRFELLAEEFDLSVRHTKTIVKQAQEILFAL
jgi:AraC-like DNA-binding protein